MSLARAAIRLHWFLSTQLGFDCLKFVRSVRGIPWYIRDWVRFRHAYRGTMVFCPCLHDRFEEGGTTRSEYFWQDLIVARMIFAARPERHLDIGSRVDGFVAHVASFRDLEVLDIRKVTRAVPGVTFRQENLMSPSLALSGQYDSVSCLHALEHFGLGRYGDPIAADGHLAGLANLAKLVRSGGRLYLSVPVGKPRVEFNANRVFAPEFIISAARFHHLELTGLTIVTPDGAATMASPLPPLEQLTGRQYALAIFTFMKAGATPEVSNHALLQH